MACQDDPRCLLFSTFKPTNEKYPGTGIDEKTHKPDFWDDIYADPNGEPPQRWAWLNHELSAIPEEERGTIPGWKLFTTTYVSQRNEFVTRPELKSSIDSGELDQKILTGILPGKNSHGTP